MSAINSSQVSEGAKFTANALNSIALALSYQVLAILYTERPIYQETLSQVPCWTLNYACRYDKSKLVLQSHLGFNAFPTYAAPTT